MVSLTPSQAVEGTAKFSNWGRWGDGTGLALPCLKNLAASAQPRNLRPRLQQGESSTVEREWEEKGERKGRRGEIQHDCLQPLLLRLSNTVSLHATQQSEYFLTSGHYCPLIFVPLI